MLMHDASLVLLRFNAPWGAKAPGDRALRTYPESM
jgi:hypothetical protein